jgi:hypothetical protein
MAGSVIGAAATALSVMFYITVSLALLRRT